VTGNRKVYAGPAGVGGEVEQVGGKVLSLYDTTISEEKGLSSYLLCA
jgi:hypothetical protein